MTIRGVIGIREGQTLKYIYNHRDSHPSSLGRLISAHLKSPTYGDLKEEILSGKFTNEPKLLNIAIDYQWHDYIYILDFEKQTWSAYKTRHKPPASSKGKLLLLWEDIPFGANLDEKYFVAEEL